MSFNFNLYEELEIVKSASAEEIKKAYRKLAMVIIHYLILIFYF
jgi:DnaJ-class molecular chaperone